MPKNRNKRRGKGGGKGQDYFSKPLSRRQATQQVKRAARIAVRPERRQIKAEQRASNLQQQRIKDWFPQYQQAIDESASRSAAATTEALSKIGQTTETSSRYAEELRQRLAKEGAAEAATRGGTYTPDTAAAMANLARRTSADTLSGVTATQGAAQQAYLADKSRIAGREKVEQLLREAARGRTYNQDLRALGREEGDIRRDEFSRLRDSERDYRLGLAAARETTASRKQEARQSKASRKSQLKLARTYAKNKKREQKRSVAGQLTVAQQQARNARADDRRSRRYLRRQTAASGGKGGQGPADADVRRALGYLRQADKNAYSSPQSAIDYLINRGIAPAAARAAVRRAQPKSRQSGTGQSVNAALND